MRAGRVAVAGGAMRGARKKGRDSEKRSERFSYISVPAGYVGLDFRSYHTLVNDKLSFCAQRFCSIFGVLLLLTGLILLTTSRPSKQVQETLGIITISVGAFMFVYFLIGIFIVCPNEWRRNEKPLPDNLEEKDVWWL